MAPFSGFFDLVILGFKRLPTSLCFSHYLTVSRRHRFSRRGAALWLHEAFSEVFLREAK